MAVLKSCSSRNITLAANSLVNGNLVAFPTETVYGLGADAMNPQAVNRLFQVKARPKNHPVIVHLSSVAKIEIWSNRIPTYAKKLAKLYWPGPMTLILRLSRPGHEYLTGGQASIGLRVPSNPVALALLAEFEELGGAGVAAPSANRFGAISATTAAAVEEELAQFLGKNDLILDDGPSQIGIESTIIDCTEDAPRILRPGSITAEMIFNSFELSNRFNFVPIKASGMFTSHYSPKAKINLGANPKPGDGFIAMSDVSTPKGVVRLARPQTIEQYAHQIYQALRQGDSLGLKIITVLLPSEQGLGMAINERMGKAAAQKAE